MDSLCMADCTAGKEYRWAKIQRWTILRTIWSRKMSGTFPWYLPTPSDESNSHRLGPATWIVLDLILLKKVGDLIVPLSVKVSLRSTFSMRYRLILKCQIWGIINFEFCIRGVFMNLYPKIQWKIIEVKL